LGCEGLILGHDLLLDWISQMPRTGILLQVRDGESYISPTKLRPGCEKEIVQTDE
jgi:hypothetical protein